jgi:hypothetical protein
MWNRQSIHSATAQDVRTMIIGWLLAGIGIGMSSALMALYIFEVICWNGVLLLKNMSCINLHLLLSFIINECLHQMIFLHLTDLTNQNPWNTSSWIAFGKKSCLVSSPSPCSFILPHQTLPHQLGWCGRHCRVRHHVNLRRSWIIIKLVDLWWFWKNAIWFNLWYEIHDESLDVTDVVLWRFSSNLWQNKNVIYL